MKRKHLDPKEYGFAHTKQRLQERYDIDVTREEYEDLCNRTRYLKDTMDCSNNNQYVLLVPLKGTNVLVVWENHRDCVTTVLPQ